MWLRGQIFSLDKYGNGYRGGYILTRQLQGSYKTARENSSSPKHLRLSPDPESLFPPLHLTVCSDQVLECAMVSTAWIMPLFSRRVPTLFTEPTLKPKGEADTWGVSFKLSQSPGLLSTPLHSSHPIVGDDTVQREFHLGTRHISVANIDIK